MEFVLIGPGRAAQLTFRVTLIPSCYHILSIQPVNITAIGLVRIARPIKNHHFLPREVFLPNDIYIYIFVYV